MENKGFRLTFLQVEEGNSIHIGVDDINRLPAVIKMFLICPGVVLTDLEVIGDDAEETMAEMKAVYDAISGMPGGKARRDLIATFVGYADMLTELYHEGEDEKEEN